MVDSPENINKYNQNNMRAIALTEGAQKTVR
jgi:hypothetical protein